MTEQTRQKLAVISSKADRVWQWEYANFARTEGISAAFTIGRLPNGRVEYCGSVSAPSEEATTALANVVRFFAQPNEHVQFFTTDWVRPCGLPAAPGWVQDPGLSDGWKSRWSDLRGELHAFLETVPHMSVRIDEGPISYGMALEIFLYGLYVHSTKRPIIMRLRRNRMLYAMVERQFHLALEVILLGIHELGVVTAKELRGQVIQHEDALPLLSRIQTARPPVLVDCVQPNIFSVKHAYLRNRTT